MALMIGGYDRTIRHRGNGIEAVEILWRPRTRTPKHNHTSKGWVWVLQGRIFEVRNGKKNYYEAGDAFLEVDSEETHIVGNDTEELAITFHVYQPELQMDMFSDSDADVAAIDLAEICESKSFVRYRSPNFCVAERVTK
jgi:quercetin dioxygenase-like cupin family protein